jgi:hypothetical protein
MATKTKREQLVYQHAEKLSRALLENHSDIVRKWVGNNPGIYALYRGDQLYYVGLASSLTTRLQAHLRDIHKDSWDQFAIYLTIRDGHIRELEALLLRIARPEGNAVAGRPKGSVDLATRIRQEIIGKQRAERRILLGGLAPSRLPKSSNTGRSLSGLFPNGISIQATHKGAQCRARIRRDGKVRCDGQVFETLELATRHLAGSRTNPWVFWHVERGRGNWVKLEAVQRAGTPVVRYAKKRSKADLSSAAKKAWRTRRAKVNGR